jgi:hypothetical protein
MPSVTFKFLTGANTDKVTKLLKHKIFYIQGHPCTPVIIDSDVQDCDDDKEVGILKEHDLRYLMTPY